MSTPPDPPIVVSGGSVTIEFDLGAFGGTGSVRHTTQQKVIKRVEIVGADITNYDNTPTGSDVTIRITYGNP